MTIADRPNPQFYEERMMTYLVSEVLYEASALPSVMMHSMTKIMDPVMGAIKLVDADEEYQIWEGGLITTAFGHLCIRISGTLADDILLLSDTIKTFLDKQDSLKRLTLEAIFDDYQKFLLQTPEAKDDYPDIHDYTQVVQLISSPCLSVDATAWQRERCVVLSFDCEYEIEDGIAVAFKDWHVSECDWAAHLL